MSSKYENIRPDFKISMRFSVIMAIIIMLGCTFSGGLGFGLISFFGTGICVLLLTYSYKIAITETQLKVYQLFVRVSAVRLDDIEKIYFKKWAQNGQGDALVLKTRQGRTKIYPVRLFERKKIDGLIREICMLNKRES